MMVAAIIIVAFAGCDSSVMEHGNANLTLNLKPRVGGEALSTNPDSTYDVNGAKISFGSARMYISEITLINDENESITISNESLTVPAKNDSDENISHTIQDQVILVKHDEGINSYDAGSWPAGDYQEIRFKVGISGTTNRIDPSQVPAQHPLAKQADVNNHWNWNAGYLFLRMDGLVDTDDDAVPDEKWAIHLGTPRFLREVSLKHDFTLENEKPAMLDISVNYAEFLRNVDLKDPDERICHTMNNLPVATAVADQISSSYQIEDR